MTNLLYSAKHYQTKCAETLDSVINYANIATELLNDAKNTAKSAAFGNIGDIKYTIRKDVPNGGFWCDGSIKTKQDLPNIYQMLLDNKFQYVTITEYEQILTEKGSCGFFGLDIANECFKLPLLNDIFIKTGQEAEVFGAESLPNITGNIRIVNDYNFDNTSIDGVINGAFEVKEFPALTGATINQNTTVTNDGIWNVSINASRSSSTYQDEAKVNPDYVKYRAYIILFFTEKEMSIVNWTNALQQKTDQCIEQIEAKAENYVEKEELQSVVNTLTKHIVVSDLPVVLAEDTFYYIAE